MTTVQIDVSTKLSSFLFTKRCYNLRACDIGIASFRNENNENEYDFKSSHCKVSVFLFEVGLKLHL